MGLGGRGGSSAPWVWRGGAGVPGTGAWCGRVAHQAVSNPISPVSPPPPSPPPAKGPGNRWWERSWPKVPIRSPQRQWPPGSPGGWTTFLCQPSCVNRNRLEDRAWPERQFSMLTSPTFARITFPPSCFP